MNKVLIWLIIFLPGSLVFSQSFKPYLLAVMEGEEDGDGFGYNLGGLGDINNDGFDDFGIQTKGVVNIYLGSTQFDSIPDFILDDGFPDSNLGGTITGVGDVNGDEINDFMIAAARYDNKKGRAYLFYGSNNFDITPDLIFQDTYGWFGWDIASGDFNNDNFDDILISSNTEGRVWLYLGGAQMDTVADAMFFEGGGLFGSTLFTGSGDVNADGNDDMLVSSHFGTFFYFGNNPVDTQADLLFHPDYSTFADFNGDGISDVMMTRMGILFGSSQFDTTVDVSLKIMGPVCAGYFNRDQYADLINSHEYGGLGAVYLYLGGNPMDNQYDWGAHGTGGGELGRAIANAGDVNGDGVEDFLVSEPGYYFGKNRGRVFLLSGDTTHLAGVAGNFPQLPKEIILHQNYPNPFNSTTTIRYEINRGALVQITIINLLGKEVKTLTQKQHSPGAYQIQWNGKDNFGNEVTSGMYFIVFKTGGLQQIKKLMVIQ